MIEINLLSKDFRTKPQSVWERFGLGLVIFWGILAVLLMFPLYQYTVMTRLDQQIQVADKQLAEAQDEFAKMARLNQIQASIIAWEQAKGQVLNSKVVWPEVMGAVVAKTPAAVTWEKVEADEGQFILEGKAPDKQKVAELMQNLQILPFVQGVWLELVEKDPGGSNTFKLTTTMSKGSTNK